MRRTVLSANLSALTFALRGSNQLKSIYSLFAVALLHIEELARLCVMVASGTMASEASSIPACRTPGCDCIGVDRFGGYCCFLCQKGKGSHGPWCSGTHGADPGPHPWVLDQRIKEINTKLRQLEAVGVTALVVVGVACACCALLKSR